MKVPCCGNVKCPYCGILVKKELLEAHVAICAANPKNKVKEEMSEDRYTCSKCRRTHKMSSQIGKDHLKYKMSELAGDIIFTPDEPISVDESAPEEQPEAEEGGIGRITIGGKATGSPPTPPKPKVPTLQKEDDTFEKLSVSPAHPELCKFIYWARDSCADCQGHRCAAASDKKLAPALIEEICKTSLHLEDCQYYIEAVKTKLPAVCPYQGPAPEGRVCCSGVWCYAEERAIRVPKSCKKFWVNCDIFARKKWAGKPFYRDLPQIGSEAVTKEVIE